MKLLKLNLQLFADEVDSSANMGEAAADSGENIIYGKQDTKVQNANAQDSEDLDESEPERDYEAEFDNLIKGDYKKQYDARVKNIISRRLKNSKQIEARLNEANSLVDFVGSMYGINSNNIQDYIDAIQNDDRLYVQEAEELGIPLNEYRNMKRTENENRRLQAMLQESENRRQNEERFAQIEAQAEGVKEIYPDFDLDEELYNNDFARLLNAGVDVKTAYEVSHHDEILKGAMAYTAQTVAKKTADSIAAKGKRPLENGISSQANATVKTDVTKLTKEDRAKIMERVMRGEKIVF